MLSCCFTNSSFGLQRFLDKAKENMKLIEEHQRMEENNH